MNAVRFGKVVWLPFESTDYLQARGYQKHEIFVLKDEFMPGDYFVFYNDGQNEDGFIAGCINGQERVNLKKEVQRISNSWLPFKAMRAAQAYQQCALRRISRLMGLAVEREAISPEAAELLFTNIAFEYGQVMTYDRKGLKEFGERLLQQYAIQTA